jgi:N-acetyl-gamma-glutamyl-phosphate reductase
MMHINTSRAAVLGASGYTGLELIGLLARHPGISTAFASSESGAGERVPGARLRYVRAEDVPLGEVDVVFTCLPHGDAESWSLRASSAGARVVDLSSDLRDGRHGAVYGLPELWRSGIREAALVANPGCYPTGVLLSLAPLLRGGLVDGARAVIVNAASGVTGAGRAAKRDLLFGEVAEDYRAYGVGNTHRHVPEIGRALEAVAGRRVDFVFTPHLLPVRRGILETICVPVVAGVGAGDVIAAWESAYASEPFVDVWNEGMPSLRSVVGTNLVALGAADVEGVTQPLVMVVAAFDNLVKGAAGQALQNANLMLGLKEGEGLAR